MPATTGPTSDRRLLQQFDQITHGPDRQALLVADFDVERLLDREDQIQPIKRVAVIGKPAGGCDLPRIDSEFLLRDGDQLLFDPGHEFPSLAEKRLPGSTQPAARDGHSRCRSRRGVTSGLAV
jgi:hypothetical protein